MWIELHVGPASDPNPITVNTSQIVDFNPCSQGTNITTVKEEYYVVESYEKVRELVIPGIKKTDDTGARLRAREEFFKGK